VHSEGPCAQSNAEAPLPRVEGHGLEQLTAILDDEVLEKGLSTDYVKKELIALDVFENISLVLNSSAIDLVEEAHHYESIENDGKELGLLPSVVHAEAENWHAKSQEAEEDCELRNLRRSGKKKDESAKKSRSQQERRETEAIITLVDPQ